MTDKLSLEDQIAQLATEMNAGGVAGFQKPLGEEELMNAVRELVKHKIKEVVRKKKGGGGYTLYAPNKGKKGNSKPVGTFPTKLGAKRAELARFPPKDPAKLARLRKSIDRMTKDPKKAAEKEKQSAREQGTDSKKESVLRENPFTTAQKVPVTASAQKPAAQAVPRVANEKSKKLADFKMALANANKETNPVLKTSKKRETIEKFMLDDEFKKDCGPEFLKYLGGILANLTKASDTRVGMGNTSQVQSRNKAESVERRKEFFERKIISTIIKKSMTESLFREEKTESDWDDYISKLSKGALAGDSKFQNLQKNISRKTENMLTDALSSIKKAVGKDASIKDYGIKHDRDSGQTYLAFGVEFDEGSAEPIYIHVEGGVPKIEVSQNAKVGLTKVEPSLAKMFRAELVTVQERVLDNMDELSRAIQSRDKYLEKLETNVDSFVAGLSSLEVSILKQLLVKKYRKI